MDHFLYRHGILHAEDVAIPSIVKAVGTPVYVYSTATLTRHYHLFKDALAGIDNLVCFAVKANSNQAVLTHLAKLGAGMDVVSGGEYARARAAGVPGQRIVFSGVGKTAAEMRMALEGGVRQFNVESEPELRLLSTLATGMGRTAPIAVRVNPDVDAGTHEKITTGKADNKFGIPIARAMGVYECAAALPGIDVVGIDVHIGSQLTDLHPFEQAYEKVKDLTQTLRALGHTIHRVDLGGGLGIPYQRANTAPPLPTEFGALIKRIFTGLEVEVEIEPGRLIAGNAGILVSRVLYVKTGQAREFLILDAAMNDLIRPAMYGAWHDIVPIVEPEAGAERHLYDVVGPVCETGDTFARQRALPQIQAGQYVAFRSAGAYGAVMASEYNTRPMIPEVLVGADQFAVIRARPTFDDIINRDNVPLWI